jgi:uncharacterized membrane protein YraQ (UPF0718 family)
MAAFLTNLMFIFLEAAPYLMVGFVVAGLLHQFLPPRFVQRHLGGHSWGNIFKASLIGTPVPLCSCGVVPVGLGLQRDGASKATTISFLIATPENGVESISLTYSFFGLPFTLARIVFAILVANLTALTVALFDDTSQTETPCAGNTPSCCQQPEAPISSCCGSQPKEAESGKRDGFRFVAHDFLPSIVRWLALGFLISAVITTFLPDNFLAQVDSRWAVPLAALIGIPMYVCASASTPIAYSLFAGGLSPGACLVFLLTGPATNSANIPVYVKAFGTRATSLYYGGIFFFSVATGLLFDAFMQSPELLGLTATGHHHFQPGPWHYLGAVSLLALIGYPMIKARKNP